jgi:hypothetical protein
VVGNARANRATRWARRARAAPGRRRQRWWSVESAWSCSSRRRCHAHAYAGRRCGLDGFLHVWLSELSHKFPLRPRRFCFPHRLPASAAPSARLVTHHCRPQRPRHDRTKASNGQRTLVLTNAPAPPARTGHLELNAYMRAISGRHICVNVCSHLMAFRFHIGQDPFLGANETIDIWGGTHGYIWGLLLRQAPSTASTSAGHGMDNLRWHRGHHSCDVCSRDAISSRAEGRRSPGAAKGPLPHREL